MLTDAFHSFVDDGNHLVAGVALTTGVCHRAKQLHRLAPTSCIAMGRLLTAAALTGLIQKRGAVSLQVIGDGYLGQLFADVTPDGDIRGYLRNPTIATPRPKGADPHGRRSIRGAVGRGSLSVIRIGEGREFHQSTTDLVAGELDADIEYFLDSSDQMPTALVCDVLFDDHSDIARAGGLIIQAMPEAEPNAVVGLKERVREEFAGLLFEHAEGLNTLVRRFLPEARTAEAPVPLRWRCRCSYGRAVAGLEMLPPGDLAQMVDAKENAEVSCDFCGKTYVISPAEVEQAFLATITAHG